MNATPKFVIPALTAAGLLVATLAYADVRIDAGIHISQHADSDITLRGDDVLITPDNADQARITPTGDLLIRDKQVPLTGDERALLRKYSAGMRTIQQHGLAIGRHAVDMVGGMVGLLVTDLLSADDGKQMDKDIRAKAEPLKQEAMELCNAVRTQKQLQDAIADELPAFRPYAVIDTDTQDDCHVNNHDAAI